MTLVNMEPLLRDARKNGYAVGSFNVLSIETVRGAIKAAEEMHSPIILQLAEVHLPAAPLEYMAPVMLEGARRANVPVCVHFDHGTSHNNIEKAVRLGFSSIMFDGASNPLDENIRLTKEIVNLAHSAGITAEAELGQVGNAEEDFANVQNTLTDVNEAVRFVRETGVDALAVSIGNLHGEYREPPVLRFDRIAEIRNSIDIPLVLHGGSGISAGDFKRCIKNGICKVNIGTAIQLGSYKHVESVVGGEVKNRNYFSIMDSIIEGTYEVVKKHLNIFGSCGRA